MQSLVVSGNFRELSQDELYEVNGGALLKGALFAWGIDAFVEAVTGRSVASNVVHIMRTVVTDPNWNYTPAAF